MRCTVCGSTPYEECNQRTHEVHDRLWKEYAKKQLTARRLGAETRNRQRREKRK